MQGHVRATGLALGLTGGLGVLVLGAALLAEPTVRDLRVHLRAGRPLQAVPFDLAVSLLAVVALTGCVLWLVLVVAASAVEAATGRSSRLVRAATPGLVRRAVLATVTVVLGGTAVVAPAAASPQDGEPVAAPVGAQAGASATALAGLPLPDRVTGDPAHAGRPRTTAVQRGDTLWGLAEALLPTGAGPAQVDRAWRELYRLNHAVIGTDPHYLEVGNVLRLPTSLMPGPSARPGETTDALTRKDTP